MATIDAASAEKKSYVNPNLEALKKMSQAELDKLYEKSEAGPIPNGDSAGDTIVFPGSPMYDVMQTDRGRMWEGKIFNCSNPEGPGTLKNKVNGKLTFDGEVYNGTSAHDGKKCIIIDYSKAPEFQNFKMQDEIRQVAKGLYLGRMYRIKKSGGYEFMLNFTCDFNVAG